MRLADLLQLEQIATGYPSREQFLTELTLDPPEATSGRSDPPLRDEDYLILSTIHSAKGQEWKPVFALNVVDGCMLSDLGAGTTAELEEERRLLYVAMMRAGQSASHRATEVFRARTAGSGRPACLCVANTLHSGSTSAAVRTSNLAGIDRGDILGITFRPHRSTFTKGCAECGDRPEGARSLCLDLLIGLFENVSRCGI